LNINTIAAATMLRDVSRLLKSMPNKEKMKTKDKNAITALKMFLIPKMKLSGLFPVIFLIFYTTK